MLHWIIKVRTTFVQLQSPFSPLNLIMREVSKYRVFSGPYFPVLVRIKENTDQKKTPCSKVSFSILRPNDCTSLPYTLYRLR